MKKIFVFLCWIFAQPAFAQLPGSLDPTFGNGGIVNTQFGISETQAKAILVQPDGKIVVSGDSYFGGSDQVLAITRYNPDGSLDASFGDGGIRIDSTPGLLNFMFASVLQPDGKIIVGGGSAPPGVNTVSRFILARYNTNGTLDHSFGSNGLSYTQVTNNQGFYGLALQPDGKIIGVGSSNHPYYPSATIVRYLSNGNIDSTFGTNGVVVTKTNPVYCQFTSVEVQPDGKILAAGSSLYDNNPQHSCFLLVRYMPDGSLDSSFGTNGIDLSGQILVNSVSFGLKLLPNGKIVLAGQRNGNSGGFAVSRYNHNGGLDPTFGSGGSVVTPVGDPSKDVGRAMTVQPDGKILVTGVTYPFSGTPTMALLRYTANGEPDTLFGTDGITNIDLGNNLNYTDGIALQSDGNIVVSAQWAYNEEINQFACARFIGGDYPLGLPDHIQDGMFKIYPNPVTDHLMVETTTPMIPGTLIIYNLSGEEMVNEPLTGSEMSVNVSFLDDGVYIIKLISVKGVETRRFIKSPER